MVSRMIITMNYLKASINEDKVILLVPTIEMHEVPEISKQLTNFYVLDVFNKTVNELMEANPKFFADKVVNDMKTAKIIENFKEKIMLLEDTPTISLPELIKEFPDFGTFFLNYSQNEINRMNQLFQSFVKGIK